MVWHVTRVEPGVVHLHPIEDLVEHELDDECACAPRSELVPRPAGPDGWLYVHNSLDGRERSE